MNPYQQPTYWPCPRCQNAIPSTSTACPVCGLQLVKKRSHFGLIALLLGGGVVLLVVLVLVLVMNRPRTTTFTPPNAPGHIVNGEGTMQSQTITLNSGEYKADWTATPLNDSGCFHSLTLRDTTGRNQGEIVLVSLDSAAPRTGTSYLHAIPAGQFYVDANSGCRWSVTLTRQ